MVEPSVYSQETTECYKKIAIVTGSSRDIGHGIDQRLGHDGASVVVTYVDH